MIKGAFLFYDFRFEINPLRVDLIPDTGNLSVFEEVCHFTVLALALIGSQLAELKSDNSQLRS